MKKRQTVALIPARGGSKGVPGKNIQPLAGYPLLAYSFMAARLCPAIDRVILTTDSPEIAGLGKTYGAEVPFLRPAELAQDHSSDIDYIRHAIDWLQSHEGAAPDAIVQLRPTTPLRDPALMETAIRRLQGNAEATSLRSVHSLPEPPQKMMGLENGFLTGLFPNDPRPEYYNLPRQTFPPAYHPNGYIDIVRADFVIRTQNLYGPKTLAYITPFTIEVDNLDDVERLSWEVDRIGHPLIGELKKRFPA